MASSPLKHSYSFTSSASSPELRPRYSLAQVSRWDEAAVTRWLHDNHLSQYAQVFADNNITGDLLFELDYRLLRQLSIATVGERIRLSVAIKKFQRQCQSHRDPDPVDPVPSGSSSSLPLTADHSASPTASSPRHPPPGGSAVSLPLAAEHPARPDSAASVPASPRHLAPPTPHAASPRLGPTGSAPGSPAHPPPPSTASTTTLSSVAPLLSKRRPRPMSSLLADAPRGEPTTNRAAETLQAALLGGVPAPAKGGRRSHRPRPHDPPDITLDSLRSQLSEFFGTTADSDISHLADSLSLRRPHGQRRCVRVVSGANETRLVDVTDAPDGRTILARILASFQIATDLDRYSLFSVSGVEGSAKSLSDEELFVLCSNAARLEREKLILRIKHQPYHSQDSRRRRDLNETIRILEQIPADRPEPSPSATSPPATKLNPQSHKKVANFFGERPPSELISSNLAQYFPGNEEKARFSMIRASVISDKQTGGRARGIASFLPGAGIRRARATVEDQRPAPAPPAKPPTPQPPVTLPSPSGGDAPGPATRPPTTPSAETSLPASPALAVPAGVELVAGGTGHRHSFLAPAPTVPIPPIPAPVLAAEPDPEPSAAEDADEPAEDEPPTETQEPPSKWIQGALIGMGSFGNVYLGLNALSGELMAVKQVEIPREDSPSEARKKLMLDALQFEIKILQDLRHPHIVRYLGSQLDDAHLNIFLEYVPGGSVAAMLANYGPLQETLVRSFVRQILKGLQYLHEREIIHRDIKGGNILVDIKGGIKISDFGISKKIEPDEDRLSLISNRASLKGSVFWMAPEVVKKTHYTRKADVWSLGCLVIEMLTGEHPFPNFTEMQAMFKIGSNTSPAIPEDISAEARDFLTQTLALDYLQRPAADALLLHPFVQGAK